MTISRQLPILITGITGTGKTTLAHTISYQRLTPTSGLCYVTDIEQSLAPILLNGRDGTVIEPSSAVPDQIGPDRTLQGGRLDPTTVVPDTIGTDATIHGVHLGPETADNTTFVTALIDHLLSRPVDARPYTLVLDGLANITLDQLPLEEIAAMTRKNRSRS